MNGVDIVIIAITGLSCLFGLWRGLVKEVFSLLTWVAALVVARFFSEHLAPLFEGILEGSTTRYIAAFAILFIVTMMLGTLINYFLSKLLTIAGLKFTDRLLGGVFGVARGLIIVLLAIFVSSTFFASSPLWQQSQLIPHGIAMIEWSKIFISDVSGISITRDTAL